MSHYEHDSGSPANSERDQALYVHAARFTDEAQALAAYVQAQEAIFAPACDVSVYRFLLGADSYVAVLGTRPPLDLGARLEAILASGEPTTLPDGVYQALVIRREEAAREGRWVERHYRRGQPPRQPRR